MKLLNKMEEPDVVIIGGGPCGAVAGALIAEAGFSCLIIEKNVLYNQSKAGIICIPVSLYKELGISKQIVEKEIFQHRFYFPSETILWKGKVSSTIIIDRKEFEHLLINRALNSGVKILTKTTVTNITKEGYIFAMNKGSAEEINLKTKLMIFANGTDSLASRTLGIGVKKKTDETIQVFSYEFEYSNNLLNEVRVFFRQEDNCLKIYRIYPGKDRLSILVGILGSVKLVGVKSKLSEFIKNFLPDLADSKPVKISVGFKSVYLARNLFTDSALTIGDTAGMANPLSEDTIAYGIKSAKVAAKACISALRQKKYGKRTLKIYAKELSKTKWWWWLKFWGVIRKIFLGLIRGEEAKIRAHLFLAKNYFLITKCLLKLGISNN